MNDSIGGGLLFGLVCLAAALVLGIGFAFAICRGARDGRHDRAG